VCVCVCVCVCMRGGLTVLLLWLYLDVARVGEEHSQPVDTQSPPSSWREAILQGSAEVLVDDLCLIVPSSFLLCLLLEPLPLHNRII